LLFVRFQVCEGASIEDVAAKPVYITNFSTGYDGNAALTMLSSGVTVITNTVEKDEPKKPAVAKRKMLEDDGEKKPAAKKRKGTKKPAAKKEKASTKKSAKKSSKAKAMEEKENVRDDEGNAASDDDGEGDEAAEYNITCDSCQVCCTEQSWHDVATGEDFCVDCRDGRGVEQCNGVNV
jgi:hypothetical protein